MTSDPHPEHTDCLEINNIGFLSPGQTKETGNLNTVRTCGYHDHGNPDDARKDRSSAARRRSPTVGVWRSPGIALLPQLVADANASLHVRANTGTVG